MPMFNSMSDGPAMVLSPPQDHPFGQFPHAKLDTTFFNGANPNAFANATPTKPSRKRSRDDAGFEEATNAPPQSAPNPAPEPEEQPIYGEGMVLLNPRTGMGLSAESQTGTWYEEEIEQTAANAPPVSLRSNTGVVDVPGRKSQRLDPSAPGLDDIALSSMHKRMQSTLDDHSGNRSSPPEEPLVDDATRLLGISWQRINSDPDDDMAPAVRGWKKYIDNQYSTHLQDCQILMKSRALNAFLVAARVAFGTAYFLFSEDLDQARLVGSTWEACVQNLRSSPVMFEGAATLRAADKADSGSAPLGNVNAGAPLLQSMSAAPQLVNGGLNGGVGMEIDS